MVVLENVVGLATSHGGSSFSGCPRAADLERHLDRARHVGRAVPWDRGMTTVVSGCIWCRQLICRGADDMPWGLALPGALRGLTLAQSWECPKRQPEQPHQPPGKM